MWEKIAGIVIAGLIGIVLGIVLCVKLYTTTDIVPATPNDYKQLEEEVNAIQQNPELLLETDHDDINIKDGIITIKFENDKCKITAKYDKNFKVVSTSKEDKSIFWVWPLALIQIIVGMVWYSGPTIVTIAIIFLEDCVMFIDVFLKEIKNTIKER